MSDFSLLPKEINHKGLFLFGVFYYLISPFIIHQTNIFDGFPGIDPWKADISFTDTTTKLYFFLVLIFVVSFYLGSFLGKKYIHVKYSSNETLGNLSSKILFAFIAVFAFMFIIKMRSLAFKPGYHNDKSEDGIGIVSTTNLLLFYIHFVIDQPPKLKKLFLVLLIINSIFLLGLGGRMYVIMPAVAYYMRAFNYAAKQGKSRFKYVAIPILGAVFAGIVGAIRIGSQIELLPYFIFAEPIFTSYSAFSYITAHTVPLVNTPYNFLVSFLNIIPSLFWPNKADVMELLLKGWAENYNSPLGALSIFTSVFADFGIILGSVFMTFFGAIFGHLYRAYRSGNINPNIYYCFCCVLPFSFFRDPIAIPIKIFILSFIILPFILRVIRQGFKKV